MPYEFTAWEQEPEPQASFSRSGSPPRKHTGIGILDPPGPPKKQPVGAFFWSHVRRFFLRLTALVGLAGRKALDRDDE